MPIVLPSEDRSQSEEPAPYIFASARLEGVDLTYALSRQEGSGYHAASARRGAIHAWRFSFCFCDALLLVT